MSDADTPRDGRPRLPRARWLVLGFVLVFIAAWAPIFFSDGDPPEDADLRIAPAAPIPPEENSAAAWLAAPRFDSPPPGSSWSWQDDLPLDAPEPSTAERARLDRERTWITTNRRALEARAAALELSGFAPDSSRGMPHDLLASLEGFERAAAYAVATGEWSDAWRWTEVGAAWHRRWFDHPLPAFPFLLTNRKTTIAITRLRIAQLMPEQPFLLEAALATTERSELPEGWRQRLIRRNYMAYFDMVGADDARWATLMARKLPPPGWAKTFHRPHRAQRLFADLTRATIDALDRGVTGTFAIEEELEAFPDLDNPLTRLVHFATGNAGGIYLARHYTYMPNALVDANRVATIEFATAATRTLLALRIHRARHGSWPASLDDLIPDVIDALPIDPASPNRAPLSYDRERGVIWGVGENGIDDGGVIGAEQRGRIIVEGDDRVVPLSYPGRE